jgi:predicted nucleic acid-binding protein
MSFMNAVDANVPVYSCDAFEPIKRAKAISPLRNLSANPAQTTLAWQAACEFLSVLRRWETADRMSGQDVIDNFRDIYDVLPISFPSRHVIDTSFSLHSRFSLSHWDSLLLAAAKEAGVDTLYSEDLSDGADYDGVTVVNPFA